MNASTLEAPTRDQQPVRPAGPAQNRTGQSRPAEGRTATRPGAPARPARRSGRGTGPSATPPRPLGTPVLTVARKAGPRSCAVAAPAPGRSEASWRLSDRAIALVLVTGLVVVAAALVVVGLTAVRVTSERYHVPSTSSAVSAPYVP